MITDPNDGVILSQTYNPAIQWQQHEEIPQYLDLRFFMMSEVVTKTIRQKTNTNWNGGLYSVLNRLLILG